MILRNQSWIGLIAWILIFQGVGFSLGLMTKAQLYPWYVALNKSILTPPGLIFSIVWSILYFLLAVVGWLLSNQQQDAKLRSVFSLYLIQILMNWAWTPIFFQWHWLGLSCLWLVVMTTINGVIIYQIKANHRKIALALIPYFLWLVFATYLNIIIWLNN